MPQKTQIESRANEARDWALSLCLVASTCYTVLHAFSLLGIFASLLLAVYCEFVSMRNDCAFTLGRGCAAMGVVTLACQAGGIQVLMAWSEEKPAKDDGIPDPTRDMMM